MSLYKWILCALALAGAPGSYALAIPQGWSLQRRADADAVVPLKFALAQPNLANLNDYLLDVSDPGSPNYGKHWTPARIAQTFRPTQDTIDVVQGWLLTDHGLEPHRIVLASKGDSIRVNVTVAEAERILGAEYFVYEHESGRERVGCHRSPTLPEHIAKHVDYVSPGPQLGGTLFAGAVPTSTKGKRALNTALAGHESGVQRTPISASKLEATGCDSAVTIDCLKDLYNFHYELVASEKNSVSVFELQGEAWQQSDLDMFFSMYAPGQVGNHPILNGIDGGNVSLPADFSESELDIELMMGLLDPSLKLQLYEIGTESDDPIDEFLAALDVEYCDSDPVNQEGLTSCGGTPLYHVVSISYHLNPDIQDPSISPVLARQCAEIGKLSLRGMTFVASSGDGGVGYSQAEGCLVNGTLEFFAGQPSSFVGQFPASCPYVTAVGATQVSPGNSVTDPETASTDFPSGAGFSNNFPMPGFQKAAVENYIAKFAPDYPEGTYNKSGRAYPDVAANGFPTVVAEFGEFFLSGGTSASAPIFASFVAAINDARLAAGKGVVGWINPALYSPGFKYAYNDVTNGTNPACGTEGFPAAPGWDPITGHGTPNFPKLLAAFLELP